MSEQSLTTIQHDVPKFSEIDAADWGREVAPPPAEPEVTPAPVADGAPETAPEVDESTEVARTRGWVPKEEWKGPEERWVDARSFNDRYESVLPVVQRENKKLNAELKATQSQLEELRKSSTEWQKFREDQQESQKKLRVEMLEAEIGRAFEEHDKDAFVRASRELRDLQSGQPPAPRNVTAQQVDPVVKRTLEDFVVDNPIFKDPKMGQVLAEQATLMRSSGSVLIGREFLDEAKERVERLYPERFRAAPQRRHAMAETGGNPGGTRNSGTRTWNDLLPEARAAADKFIATTPGATREGWLKSATDEYFRSR